MGAKRRNEKAIELVLEAHGTGFSRKATVDLVSGRCVANEIFRDASTKKSRPRDTELSIRSHDLIALRRAAASILAAGDVLHREQFAAMEVSFSARTPTRAATATFEIDVGSSTVYDAAWDLVFGYLES